MYFQYGNYRHESGECQVDKPNPQNVYSDDGQLTAIKVRLTIKGRKHAATPGALTSALQEMEAAYAVNGQDAVLREDSGTATAIKIISANTTRGVRVVQPPAYTNDTPASYTTFVDYTIILEAEITALDSTSNFNYRESVVFNPPAIATTNQEFVFRHPLEGQVQRQASDIITFQCRQSGSVSSNLFWLQPQMPMYPGACHWKQSSVSYDVQNSKGAIVYVTTWDYAFESDSPLSGYPSLRLY